MAASLLRKPRSCSASVPSADGVDASTSRSPSSPATPLGTTRTSLAPGSTATGSASAPAPPTYRLDRSPRAGHVNAAQILPSSATTAPASSARSTSPPRPGSLRSPRPPARATRSRSARPVTSGCAWPLPALPTTRATPRPGPPLCASAPALEAATTSMPHASWPAHGFASSGAAGRTAAPMTPPSTNCCHIPPSSSRPSQGLTQGVS